MKLLKKSDKGFTIIEVLIVLVIASSILLIVFLAVPQLQRNSRNTQRKSGIATIAGAINEYTATNNSALPDFISATGSNPHKLCATDGCDTGSPVEFNMGYYLNTPSAEMVTITSTLSEYEAADNAVIVKGAKCPASVTGSTVTPEAGSARSAAIVYGTETASDFAAACLDV